MAGTLVVDTLTITGNQGNAVNGIAKAWANFTTIGGVATIRASYNIGSITRNGTGDYTVNFAVPFADANYVTSVSIADTPGGTAFGKVLTSGGYAGSLLQYSTTGVRVGGTTAEFSYFGIVCYR